MIDAKAGHDAEDRIGIAVLRAGFHPRLARSRRRRGLRLPRYLRLDHLLGDRADCHAASREANELASIHRGCSC